MRILYLHQYFKTREGYGSTRSYEFAHRLARAGHEVLVISSTARMPAVCARKGRIRGMMEGTIDGITVWGVPSAYSNRMGFARRVVEFLKFALVSTIAVLRAPRPDLVYASSTPLTVAVPALAGRIFRGIPFVFEVRDLWPEVPAGMGILRNGWLVRAAKALAGAAYRKSAGIVALSPGMRDGIVRYGIDPSRICVIPNGSDLDLFHPGVDGKPLRDRLGLSGTDFLIVHTGAMGIVNGLEFLLPVCEELARTLPRAVVYLVGEGGQRARLEAEARRRSLGNLRFEGPVSKDEVPQWLAAADLGLMIIRRIPVLEMNSANKFFDYAAAGLPCLMNYGGWKGELLLRYGAGVPCGTDSAEEFARAIASLASDPEKLAAMGLNARVMAEKEFDRDLQFERLMRFLEGAVHRSEDPGEVQEPAQTSR